jgi:hypothetical protein
VESSVEIHPCLKKLNRLITKAKSLHGVISHLTHKYNGNVHEKAFVTITSKSPELDPDLVALINVADLTTDLCFQSDNELDSGICWDFSEICIVDKSLRSFTQSE